ncbi:beta-microseminoprotein [Perognathus longimembris pacificus]|uniref:beta-microseminoprotein n=1 Tax=Perognathus longimembris pacificus TaxID=214514 RepID=UPI0020198555|nr:beta-microseminoprotein [Perognathus longimembris pacificus]
MHKKVLLGSLVVLATFMTSCNTQCSFIPGTEPGNNFLYECQDNDGVRHPIQTTWQTKNCFECSCSDKGIQCCNKVPVPSGYDKINCKKIFYKENCTYSVVERDDPEKTCNVHSWVL